MACDTINEGGGGGTEREYGVGARLYLCPPRIPIIIIIIHIITIISNAIIYHIIIILSCYEYNTYHHNNFKCPVILSMREEGAGPSASTV